MAANPSRSRPFGVAVTEGAVEMVAQVQDTCKRKLLSQE